VFSPSRMSKRVLGMLALGCVALYGASFAFALQSASPAAAAATAPPKCKASGLVVWLDTQGDGAAGSVFYNLEFTNVGSQACTLKGYPGVAAVNLAGKQLGSVGTRSGETPRPVKIAPESSATALLRIVEAGNYSAAECHPVTAAGVRVSLPGLPVSRAVSYPFPACVKTGPKILGIGPVKP
jgi:Protein of unknown function (DUF4232)